MKIKSINHDDFRFTPRTFLERAFPYLFILTLAVLTVATLLFVFVLSEKVEFWRALPVAVFAVAAWVVWSFYKGQHRTDAYNDYLAGFESQELRRELDGGGIDDGTVSAIKDHLNHRRSSIT